ncbi:Uncharacterized protein M6B38_209900 [Iris pallida]|uniref:Carbohydrate kinase PfkB domain-containing protein n=1 Tax=Iris pallida TaxID=29817 RepID=A0AAX6E3M0_IRIPA|nr:Uncharacterized protein M6B38_209900 [Iris pallida]
MLLTYPYPLPSSLSQKLPSLSPYPYSYSYSYSNRRRRLFLPITRACRAEMSSPAPPPLPDNRVVLGCGGVSVDYLATVAAYPKPDDKIRSTSLKVEGGGNVGNALTGAARLGLQPRVISKVANDAQGRNVLEEFEKDGVDTSYMVVSEGGNSPFTYVIVDNQTKTRTCIHTPGSPPMLPDELSNSKLYSAIEGANLVYLDVRLHETAIVVAEEATRRKIPILIDAERKREGLDELLNLATYVVCSAKFPQARTTDGSPLCANCISIHASEIAKYQVFNRDSWRERLHDA